LTRSQTARLALVTGASSGIGLEFARQLASEGYNVILIARRLERLEALREELVANHAVTAYVLPLDLAVPGAADLVVEFLETNRLSVHTLVNNAGFGLVGRFDQTSRAALHEMIQLNVAVLADLTRCLIPGMIERGEGRVLNVASSAAFQPAPLMGLYHATKSFVLFLTEAISEELRGTGVTATALCPGPVGQTEFGDHLGTERKVPAMGLVRLSARDVARQGLRGSSNGKAIVVPGLMMKISALITPRLPRWFVRKATHRIQKSRA
jgi:short-subunit dehydrogenase